ncbi:putative quinol monooxygenase [Sporichthya sp.]|uniref:putative quinol monooxygenase n=1 Tax=Sporichthya sp. TaxID=65475 RepID=UPI00179ABB11|nr:antibiotic biosynthesis monooxygenase family protein [Sporichthya sp.]MBA3745315.1 antibiotic biosynthesis monooxygenase [Sporichthya sp.]
MVYEHAHLVIDPARADEFEAAVPLALKALRDAPGCQEANISRSVDQPGTYLLRAGWDHLEDHLEVFPTTPQAATVGEAIAGFFTEAPLVIHFEDAQI